MMKRVLVGMAALALVAGVAFWSLGRGGPGTTALVPFAAEAQEAVAADPVTDPAAVAAVKNFAIGAEDAPIKFIEYASFTCPHCARFHADVFARLKADYIDTGKVRFEYHEVYFDRYGLWAAMMARCGGDLRYFGISSILYQTQAEWAASEDPAVVFENLKKIGRTAGMEDAALDVCMKDAKQAELLVAHFEAGMKADDVQGTPTLIINGVKHPNMSYDDLKVVLDAELAK
jgi:protein-disulfide isomerase